MAQSPESRSLNARIAAHTMHARNDSKTTTQPARDAFMAKFETAVDPLGTLDPQERRRRAEHEKTAYFARLGKRSGEARRRRR